MTVKRAIALYDGLLKELSSADTLYSARTYHGIESFGVVSFNNTSHVVSVASGSNIYWYKGVRFYTADAISCDLDDYVTLTANTLYYVYFDDATGTLKANSTVWNLREKVPVATVYWNGSIGAPSNECHGHDRGVGWHINAHLTIGCRYYEGLNVLKPTTSLDSALEIEAGTLFDEDIQIDITPAKTNCRIWYLASAGKYTFVNSDLPYAGTSGQPQYLDTDTYALANVGTSQYVCMWVYGSGDTDRPIYIFPSAISTPYATIAAARAEAIPVLSGLGLNPELKLLHRLIYRGNGEFQESEDFRRSSSLPSGFVASTSAGSVTFAPYNDITGTNVQTAIEQTVDKFGTVGSGIAYSVISTNTNAVAGNGYLINASAGNIILTLPGSPSTGNTIAAVDIYNKSTTNTITLARNGSNIEGIAEDMVFDIDGAGFILVYADSTRGWEIVSEIGASVETTGLFEIDVDGGIMPITDIKDDQCYELDVNGDIQPI